ncbi:MAG: hypothetical protein KatS3mg026_0924 [Bacteroidia bacterium]|nr:MAG: hypothetical protein KatS3mg026_0924 [Bacteroidia bacterium]
MDSLAKPRPDGGGLPPTLVEDYTLLEALKQAGWRFQWVWHPAVLGETRAEPTFRRWYQQRLRWRQAVGQVTGLSLFYWGVQSLLPWTLLFLQKGWAWLAFSGRRTPPAVAMAPNHRLPTGAAVSLPPCRVSFSARGLADVPVFRASACSVEGPPVSRLAERSYLCAMTYEALEALKERLAALRRFL